MSLFVTGTLFLFLLLASLCGYPLEWNTGDAMRVSEIVVPVVLGYLGSAAAFYFTSSKTAEAEGRVLQGNAVLVLKGSTALWVVLMGAALFAFGWTNRTAAPQGTGWSVDTLALILSMTMGLMSLTVSGAVAYLFQRG